MTRRPKNTAARFLKKSKFLFPSLLFLAILVGGFFWWQWATKAVTAETKMEKTFVIKKNESLSSVAKRLQKESLIRSSLAFKLLILKDNLAGKIQAGSFSLKSSFKPQEIAEVLTHGTNDVWLTFPEGWRKEEFARHLANNLANFDQEQFLDLARDHEGELFPDTYLIAKEASASAVFHLLQNNFQKKFNEDLVQDAKKAGLNPKEVLILASLVEREVKDDQDRPLVAGILIKRWQADWPLQVDATLQYSLANLRCSSLEKDCNWWVTPTAADRKINSPYNTYLNRGLPPTPICNPGLSSLKAVIYSQKSDYWFYLSDDEGKMHYAKTMEEHNENIRKYLSGRESEL